MLPATVDSAVGCTVRRNPIRVFAMCAAERSGQIRADDATDARILIKTRRVRGRLRTANSVARAVSAPLESDEIGDSGPAFS